MIRRILVGLTGTPYTDVAVRHARQLAQRFDASVTGIAIADEMAAATSAPAHFTRTVRVQTLREAVGRAVTDFASSFVDTSCAAHTVLEQGHPFDQLCSQWRHHDLTILGLRGLFDYGVVDEPHDLLVDLIKAGVRPMLAVPEHYSEIRRVAIAYSGSLESAKAMKRFAQLRLWPDATVRIVHFTGSGEPYEDFLPESLAYCRDWGLRADLDIEEGDAVDGLLPYASRTNADLVVLGDSAHSLFVHGTFGGTAQRLIREAETALFLSH